MNEAGRGDAPGLRGFLRLACERSVVRRALAYAVVVGSVLIAINHGDAILAADLTPTHWWKMALTLLVPYTVSTLSSVSATRSARAAAGPSPS